MLLTRSRGQGVVHLSMIATAVFALLLADLGFAYKHPSGTYGTGAMLDAGWVIGWLLGATALKPTVAELRPPTTSRSRPSPGSPSYAPLIVAAVTGVFIQITTGEFEPVLVFTGTTIGLLVISRQIVALIENRQLNARLRAMVAQLSERERELKDGLRRELAAADKLQAADDMKDTFLRAVSHDLRTPLTAMLGVAVTLEADQAQPAPRPGPRPDRDAGREDQEAGRLLKDLLDLNRLEEGARAQPLPDRRPRARPAGWSPRWTSSPAGRSTSRPRPSRPSSTAPRSSGSWRTCC